MSTLRRILFEMPDGTVEGRLYEGPSQRTDRDPLGIDDVAELLRRDRGAVSVTILPYTPPVRGSQAVATGNPASAAPMMLHLHTHGVARGTYPPKVRVSSWVTPAMVRSRARAEHATLRLCGMSNPRLRAYYVRSIVLGAYCVQHEYPTVRAELVKLVTA